MPVKCFFFVCFHFMIFISCWKFFLHFFAPSLSLSLRCHSLTHFHFWPCRCLSFFLHISQNIISQFFFFFFFRNGKVSLTILFINIKKNSRILQSAFFYGFLCLWCEFHNMFTGTHERDTFPIPSPFFHSSSFSSSAGSSSQLQKSFFSYFFYSSFFIIEIISPRRYTQRHKGRETRWRVGG